MSRSHIIQPESKPWNPWHIPHIPPGSWEEVPREVLLCRLDGPRALRPAGGMRLHPLAFQAGPAKSWTWSLNPGHGQVKKDVFVGYKCYNVEKRAWFDCLVVLWNHGIDDMTFPSFLGNGIILPSDEIRSIIFQRGRSSTNQLMSIPDECG